MRGRAHIERIGTRLRKAVRSADVNRDRADTGILCRHRHRNAPTLLDGKLKLLWTLAVALHRPVGRNRHAVIASGALNVIEFKLHRAAVAGAKEARQGRRQHDCVAHNDIAGGLADLVAAPGHRHDADSAGKRRNIERHIGRAIGADRDDP